MNICVFCGSNTGVNPEYARAAITLANILCTTRCTLVYGGGNIGIMGILADEMLQRGGQVIGVIPDFLLQREVGHTGITKLEVVGSMHERKKRMADLADAFIALPGGWGTLDELAEILTWKQLGLVNAPIGLLNTGSFFDPLLRQMDIMVKEGFLSKESFDQLRISQNPHLLLTSIGVDAA
jgi:uncharacterized protein (TIGR00730 family)